MTARRRHFSKNLFSGVRLGTFDAHINDGVVRNCVARHALDSHFTKEFQGGTEVFLEAMALDEHRVKNCISVPLVGFHVLEDLHRLLQMAAFDTCIYHATVGHGVGMPPLFRHFIPDLQDPGDVATLPIRLDKDAQCHVRGVDFEFPHALHGGLQAAYVLHSAASVQERVEEHLVSLLRLLLDELFHQGNATVNLCRGPACSAVAHCLH
mmetsp:Transcript_109657/g.212309  ORF Transcript_109657/g.212309 Transcript_109657/m.212309 type:complete len:209 (-) Transcript_109657:278-904(-)